ncbi:MAG: DNA translocase FtsK 4TM domain-containing protein, partial [Candidatus Aminicenantes bacterium]|nr:DNA translocase FtsK 4TM domain-containing protein [Candidatus Aminicenantes bacterium]
MKNGKRGDGNSYELSIKSEIFGIVFLFLSILLIFSLVSYSPFDPSFFHSTMNTVVENYGGNIGSEISAFLFVMFGYASFILIIYFLFITIYFFLNRKIRNFYTKSSGFILLLISFSALLSNIKPYSGIDSASIKTGGIIGFFLNEFFESEIKGFLTFLLFLILVFISLTLIAKLSLQKILKALMHGTTAIFSIVSKFYITQSGKFKNWRMRKRIEKKHSDGTLKDKVSTAKVERKKSFEQKKEIVKKPSGFPEEPSLFKGMGKIMSISEKYVPPPLSYLDASTERSKIDFKELEEKKNELSARLNEFRIKGEILEYTPGPVITTYEFVPDTGVKVKDVVNLAEDLALVAEAQYVRIERILGKKAIGIEIPNKKREIIHLREILESEEFAAGSSPLTIALGKTKSGEVFTTDLREMPHVIIAGATGSGKSVAIHTIILSIVFRSSPEDVKLILIDPKRVELAIYNSLPHLMTPVVVNPKLAKNALDWAIFEMEKRYKKLAQLQVRNIEQYNKRLNLLTNSGDEIIDTLEDAGKIPYIVIIIDEFADLMMESSKDIEYNVARIAQKARAVGIHLILATQRPSVDVITGTIKNNFPSRIAFAVPSRNDSKTIIDYMGAEKLLGQGDMLILPPKSATLVRAHCSFVSEEEALRVVKFLSKKSKPEFNTEVIKPKVKTE